MTLDDEQDVNPQLFWSYQTQPLFVMRITFGTVLFQFTQRNQV